MPIIEGKIRTSTGLRNPKQPITAIRPAYNDAGVLTACRVEVEALMNDGSSQEVVLDLLPLITAPQRTILATILTAIATRVRAELA